MIINLMLEDSLQAKQAYLRDNILDQGYQSEAFCSFMSLRKDNWEDLSLWTPDELVAIVQQFIALQQGVQGETADVGLIEQQESPAKEPIIEYSRYKLQQQPFSKTVKTLRTSSQPAAKRVVVEDLELRSYGGYFFGIRAVKEATYRLKVPDLKLTLERRQSDIQWLRKAIAISNPHLIIPPLKSYKFKPEDEQKQKRKAILNTFFYQFCNRPQLSSSKAFKVFLESDQAKFQLDKDALLSKKVTKKVENVQFPEGETITALSKKLLEFITQFLNLSDRNHSLLTQVKRGIRQVAEDLKRVSTSMKVLSKHFKLLQENFGGFNKKFEQFKIQLPENFFKQMSELSNDWANSQLAKASVLSKFELIFKYIRHQYRSIQEVVVRRAQAQDFYLNYRSKLFAKKQRIFNSKLIEDWEINKQQRERLLSQHPDILENRKLAFEHMCFKDTRLMEQIRDWLGLMTHQTMIECRGVWVRGIGRLRREMIGVSDSMLMELHQEKQIFTLAKQLSVQS